MKSSGERLKLSERDSFLYAASLHNFRDGIMFASDIAANLDYSRQLVAARGKILDERGLVERIKNKDRREYKLTNEAEEKYFTSYELDNLDY